MRLTRSRGLSRSPGRDYDAERAALQEGYRNEAELYRQGAEEALAREDLSAGEKKAMLERYRAEFTRLQTEYEQHLEEINRAQMLEYADSYGEAADAGFVAAADEYCDVEGQELPDASADQYCGMDGQEPTHAHTPAAEDELEY